MFLVLFRETITASIFTWIFDRFGNDSSLQNLYTLLYPFFRGEKMENFITLTEAAEKWDLSARRVRTLCSEGRINGASKLGRNWAIPVDAKKPADNRIKSGKYVKSKA